MSTWQELTGQANRIADDVFGELVRLSFFRNGSLDPSRQPLQCRAQLHLPGEGPGFPQSKSQFSMQVIGGTGLLIVQKHALGNVRLSAGDKVKPCARDEQPWFEIVSVDARGQQVVAQISLSTKQPAQAENT